MEQLLRSNWRWNLVLTLLVLPVLAWALLAAPGTHAGGIGVASSHREAPIQIGSSHREAPIQIGSSHREAPIQIGSALRNSPVRAA